MAVHGPSIGELLGHYRLLEQIGQGGMGLVFRARDERLERDVAVKVLPPGTFPDESARKKFHHEALVLGKLNHPNLLMAFDFCQQDGIDYLVTEYVSGTPLDAKLAKGPLPQKLVLELGLQLAKGLARAHREEIVHRDLKPANLRLTDDGELKILDFGLARWREPVSDLAETQSVELANVLAGTLPYMAPEQIRCEEIDSRTDIWGAGCVLYEMATGYRPFQANSTLKLMETIQHADPPAPSVLNKSVAPALDAIILKALDKDPERRYQSARELGVDLARLLTGSSASTLMRSDYAVRPRMPRRVRWAAVAAVVLILAALGYWVFEKSTTPIGKKQRLLTVLPFDATGQDEKTSALISGLTETLTAKLAQPWGKELQLVSAREVKEQGIKTADQAYKEFGTDLVLEGSAHRVGDQIRIVCSLVDPKTHRQITAHTITAATQDVFGLEDQVANEVISLLASQTVTPGAKPPSRRGVAKPEAYASYLRARGYLQEYQKPENIDLAVAELKNAIAVDKDYANAYAALGEAYLQGYQQANHSEEWVGLAQQNCTRSLAIHETAEGLICLGDVYNQTGKYDVAAQQFHRALEIDPKNEDGLRGEADAYVRLGKAAEAEEAYKASISLRPNYWGVYSWLGKFYYDQARYAEAITQFQKVIELAPGNYRGYSNLGAMYVAQAKYPEALSFLNKSIEIRPNLEAFNNLGYAYFGLHRFSEAADAFQRGLNLDESDWLLWGNLGDALFWSGAPRSKATSAYANAIQRAEKKLQVNPKDTTVLAFLADYNAMSQQRAKALEQIERAMALAPSDSEVRMRAAIVYNQLGDQEHCLAALEKAVQLGYSAQVIKDTPDFDRIHDNPRFRALAQIH